MQLYFLIEVVKLCLASRLVRGINLCNNIKEYGGGGSSFRGGGTSMRKSKKNNSNHIKFHAQYLMHDILSLKFWGTVLGPERVHVIYLQRVVDPK